MRVAVCDGVRTHQAPGVLQGFQNHRHGLPDVLAAKQREISGVGAVALHRVEDGVVGQPIGYAGIEIFHAVGGRGMDDAGAVVGGGVLGQVDRRGTGKAGVHMGERVVEFDQIELLTHRGGHDAAAELPALQALFHQRFGAEHQAFGRVHQRVDQGRVQVQRLVGRNRPSRRGPDDGKSVFFQLGQSKCLSQFVRFGAQKRHVQRVALLVRVFDLELRQRRAAVKTPINRLQAAIHKTALDHPLECADFARLVGRVHGAVGPRPIAQHAQALEVLALLADLFGGEGAAFGLHVVSRELAAVQFFNRVFDRQAVAVPAGDVLRVKTGQLARLDDHVFQNLVDRVADVQFAVGVRRPVVQDKQWCAFARNPQALVQT